MTSDPTKKDGNGSGDDTRHGAVPPPPKVPSAPKAPEESGAKPETPAAPKEDTQLGRVPPVAPKLPGGGPATPPSTPAGGAAQAPPSPPPAETEDEEGTVLLAPERLQARCSLQRVEPPGHSDVIQLVLAEYSLGRGQGTDIRLYSATASRQHAQLVRRDDAWWIEPAEGKTVLAGGELAKGTTRLTHKMRLRLGDDELLFFDEEAALRGEPARAPAKAGASGRGLKIAVVIAAVLLALAALWMVLGA